MIYNKTKSLLFIVLLCVSSLLVNCTDEPTPPTRPATIVSFTASPTVTNYGSIVNLNWETISAIYVELYEQNIEPGSEGEPVFIREVDKRRVNSSYNITVDHNTRFILKAVGYLEPVAEAYVDITVNKVESKCSIKQFTAIPNPAYIGETVKLYFETQNCEGPVYIKPSDNVVSDTDSSTEKGSYTWIADQSTAFELLVAPFTSGNEKKCEVDCVSSRINVGVEENLIPNCQRITLFEANKYTASKGETVTLRWKVENASEVSAKNFTIDPQQFEGSTQVVVNSTTTYTLTAQSDNQVCGTIERRITINVADDDNDGVENSIDNCPTTPNPDQADNDDDNIGDVCDPDDDNDNIPDTEDNCPLVYNPSQTDSNNNNIGDACEDDSDGDGIANNLDNCPEVSNPDQANNDDDEQGDECDADDDNDNIIDAQDNCQFVSNQDQLDNDDDEQGDECDPDDDNDDIQDLEDNCPFVANNDQQDTDSDNMGNVCDSDDDNDGIYDDGDNSGQEGDNPCTGGQTDNCDDNCPVMPNDAQLDNNSNGIGDACEESLGDICDTANIITFTNDFASWSSDWQNYYQDFDTFSPCNTANGRDVYFSVTVPAQKVLTVQETSEYDSVIHILTDCSTTACTASADDGNNDLIVWHNNGEETNVIVIVQAYSQFVDSGLINVEFALNDLNNDGDSCDQPLAVNSFPTIIYSDLSLLNNDINLTDNSCATSEGNDQFLSITVPSRSNLNIREYFEDTDVVFHVINDCSSSQCTLSSSEDFMSWRNDSDSDVTIMLVVKARYDGIQDNVTAIEIDSTPIPAGDSCSDPNIITALPFESNEILENYIDDHMFDTGSSQTCGRGDGIEIVYQYTISDNETINISLTSSFDAVLRLIGSDQCIEDGICINYADDAVDNGTETLSYTNDSGNSEVIYIVVETYYSYDTTGTFTLDIY